MSDYKPGAVATVTYKGKRWRAHRWSFGWCVVDAIECDFAPDHQVTDVTPLVVIEATREDADVFDFMVQHPVTFGSKRVRLSERYRDAIREQIPEPEPPKRWLMDANRGGKNRSHDWLYDTTTTRAVGPFPVGEGQAIADALNAAEQTP